MATPAVPSEFRRLTTPRSAAIAGVLFAALFAGSLVLLRIAIPADVDRGTDWLEQGTPALSAALTIMPFAGISFLWFIGVVRDVLGDAEDKFFASVFLAAACCSWPWSSCRWRLRAASSHPRRPARTPPPRRKSYILGGP